MFISPHIAVFPFAIVKKGPVTTAFYIFARFQTTLDSAARNGVAKILNIVCKTALQLYFSR